MRTENYRARLTCRRRSTRCGRQRGRPIPKPYETLDKIGLFHSLDAKDRAALAHRCQWRHAEAKEWLLEQNDVGMNRRRRHHGALPVVGVGPRAPQQLGIDAVLDLHRAELVDSLVERADAADKLAQQLFAYVGMLPHDLAEHRRGHAGDGGVGDGEDAGGARPPVDRRHLAEGTTGLDVAEDDLAVG